jgi:glycerophosphoryl diester phosphodiesterase
MRLAAACVILTLAGPAPGAPPDRPVPVGHRGLLRDAPENTLAGFAACLDLGLGFELDVRRTRDGTLVVLHDETVDRTTDGKGRVADLTLTELRRLDAGRRFDPAFAGRRVPTLEEVFALVRDRGPSTLVAVDLKLDDPTYEANIVALANRARVLPRLVFIGRAIDRPEVRRRLKAADRAAQACVLAQAAKDLPAALADPDAAWVYARFVPTAEEAAAVRKAGKKLFLSGRPVNGLEPDNFRKAREIGADALLTDFPLDCRRVWREGGPKAGQ